MPWAAFVVALAIADTLEDGSGSGSGVDVFGAALFSLFFVGIPSAVPIAAARRAPLLLISLVVMTATAAVAGVLVVTTEDAQAGLAVLWVPFVAVPMAAAIWVGRAVAARRRAPRPEEQATPSLARPSDRLAALAIDVAVVGAVLVAPLTAMSHAEQEIGAVVVGVLVATVYLGGPTALLGRTPGQSLLRLRVVDARTGARVAVPRALLRSLVTVLEVMGIPLVLFGLPALAEFMAVSANGHSITDRLLKTSVLASP